LITVDFPVPDIPVSTRRDRSRELSGESVPRLVLRRTDGWWVVVPDEHCH
jgi:hypothetical protein